MKILKPLQNTLKKRITFTKCSNFMVPKIWVHDIPGVSFKTVMLDLPFIGTLEFAIQK